MAVEGFAEAREAVDWLARELKPGYSGAENDWGLLLDEDSTLSDRLYVKSVELRDLLDEANRVGL